MVRSIVNTPRGDKNIDVWFQIEDRSSVQEGAHSGTIMLAGQGIMKVPQANFLEGLGSCWCCWELQILLRQLPLCFLLFSTTASMAHGSSLQQSLGRRPPNWWCGSREFGLGVWHSNMVLLMEEILHHLGCVRPYRYILVYLLHQLVQDSFHQQYHVKRTDIFWRWEPSLQEICSSFRATGWWTCSELAGLAEAVAMLYKQPKQTCFDMCLGIFTCSLVSKSTNSNSLKVFFSVSASAKVWFVAWKFS